MRPNTESARKSPNTARSAIRDALRAGIAKCTPSKAMVHLRAWPQCENESDVRDGKQHAARVLDVILQRLVAAGVPYEGPNGTAQIVARLDFALRHMHRLAPNALDLKAARRAAQAMDSKVDLLECDLEDMNDGQLEDFAAYAEACGDTHYALALAARARAFQQAESRRGARRQLAAVA